MSAVGHCVPLPQRWLPCPYLARNLVALGRGCLYFHLSLISIETRRQDKRHPGDPGLYMMVDQNASCDSLLLFLIWQSSIFFIILWKIPVFPFFKTKPVRFQVPKTNLRRLDERERTVTCRRKGTLEVGCLIAALKLNSCLKFSVIILFEISPPKGHYRNQWDRLVKRL